MVSKRVMIVVSVDDRGEYAIERGSRIPVYKPLIEASAGRAEMLSASYTRKLVWPAIAIGFLLHGTDEEDRFVHNRAAEIRLDPDALARSCEVWRLMTTSCIQTKFRLCFILFVWVARRALTSR